MDKQTKLFQAHHTKMFLEHGPTAMGVHWGDDEGMHFRYVKMLDVLRKDFYSSAEPPSLLDVGCGWGGLFHWATQHDIPLRYSGVDVVEPMIAYCKEHFPQASFHLGDVFDLHATGAYDFVVCSGILTQRLVSQAEMEVYARRLIRKMFDLCKEGIAFNLMSNQVNFTVDNLYYKSPVETLAFCLGELAPRVRIDHGYSSLASGRGKYYDYTVYVYKG